MPSRSPLPAPRRAYPSDLSDDQWDLIEPFVPTTKSGTRKGGRPVTVDRREIVNAVLYRSRTGCSWQLLPHDFPPAKTVFHYFNLWKLTGVWELIHDALRAQVRLAAGKEVSPSVAIVDSQSTKTTEKGGPKGASMAEKR